uniref:Uncharacterized protein n=1 Tax=Tanacetum cinerariifolium TaxID=118510 RepID=A0A699GWZ2_TANCI|nr:hypothetical protein [Tanacetum cinerariifolium]
MGRYAQWQSRFLRYINTRPNGDDLGKFILQGPYTPSTVTILVVPATNNTSTEVIHLLLIGIGDEIYPAVDARKTAHKMWIAIDRLQQSESLNIQDVNTNLFWKFRKFTSQDGELMESYYSRFYKMVNEMIRNNLIVATIIAKNANLLTFVVAAQLHPDPYYQASKSHKSYAPTSKASPLTRSHVTTKHKGKEIAKPIIPPSELAFKEDNTNEKIDEQELEARYSFMAKIQELSEQHEYISNTCVVEKVYSNVILDSPDMYDNDIQTNQNDIECNDERVALANLIAKLKLNVDENKKIKKQLKKANTSLAHELKECKSILAKTSRTLRESNSIQDSFLIALQNK